MQQAAESVASEASHAAPIDTGALSASIYATGPNGRTYEKAKGAMLSNNPTAPIEPELVLDDFSGEQVFVAAVDNAAEYADLIHDGFHQASTGRHVAGRPFLTGASVRF